MRKGERERETERQETDADGRTTETRPKLISPQRERERGGREPFELEETDLAELSDGKETGLVFSYAYACMYAVFGRQKKLAFSFDIISSLPIL